jgi:hypothetical protein
MKEKIIAFLKSKQAKTFYWQSANGFVVLVIGLITTIQPDVIDPKGVLAVSACLAVLNGLTKFINKNYL